MNEFMESVFNFSFDVESDIRNLFDDTTHLQLIVRDNHFSVFVELSCFLRMTYWNDHEDISFHDVLSIWNDFNYENWNLMNMISLDFNKWLIMKIVSFYLFLFLFLYLIVKGDRLVTSVFLPGHFLVSKQQLYRTDLRTVTISNIVTKNATVTKLKVSQNVLRTSIHHVFEKLHFFHVIRQIIWTIISESNFTFQRGR